MNVKRVFLIVLDSFGIGALHDAADFGDEGSNTLAACFNTGKLCLNTMKRLGLFNIDGIEIDGVDTPAGAYGRFAETSAGKDTTVGHWEICGYISEKPLPTYPDGFPDEIIDKFKKRTGRGVLCNKPYSGTKVLMDYGEEHLRTGDLIVYTSADSVFQIAAHEDIVPVEKLYEYCEIAREILTGEHAVGRVIARPFKNKYPDFIRTENRHDFSLEPQGTTLLDKLTSNGFDVIPIGKIYDIFAGRGMSQANPTSSNADGMKQTADMLSVDFNGLCFTNLVDFDMKYGHRNDVDGYTQALNEFDAWLGSFIGKLKETDLLFITADHGCDPSTESTDHSREYVPLLVYGKKVTPLNLNTHNTFADIGKTIADIFGVEAEISGTSFMNDILR